MANGKVLKGPYWTRNWIEAMWRFTNENFVDFDTGAVDYEALGKEEFQFRKALFFRNFKNSERAKMAFASAEDDYKNPVENGKKGGRPKKSPQDAPNGNAGVDMSDAGNGAASKSPTSCDQFTADGDIREDSQARIDGSAITRNETRAHDALGPSANIYGDAATREGAEVVDSRESGVAAPTTVSRNMRRVPQTEAPAHGFSGGRTAQGTMSRSPEAAAQSGKDYDQEARQSRRTGGSSVRGMAKVAQPSVRSRASFRNKEDFIQWAIDDGLDPVDAGECWEATEERGGKDADGNTVKNMKAFARQWCRTRANNRRTA